MPRSPLRIILLSTVVLTGCGDDTQPATGGTDETTASSASMGSAGTDAATTDAADTSTAPGDAEGSSSADGGTTTAGSSSSGGTVDVCGEPPDDPCLRCGFEQCVEPFAACCELSTHADDGTADGGCLPLVSCALATGCVHAECYQPDTCMAEVDGAGGITGDGTAAAANLGDCLGAAVAAGASEACLACQAGGA